MKILVTGCRGTVGLPLTQELRSRGHEVWGVDLAHWHEDWYTRCNMSQFRQLEKVIKARPFDYVYHLAAEFGRWNGEDYYEDLWASNVIGTKHLIRLQEELNFRMIFFSSSEVYGDYDQIMYEDVMDKHEIRQLNDYALTKWVSEQQILNSAAMTRTETVRVRLFNTYGPGEYYSPYRSVICLFCYRALTNQPYTVYLSHHRTSSYITDTARTLANIVDNFKPGEVYNIGGTEYHDIKAVSDLILECLGKDDRLVHYKEAEEFTTKDKKVDLSKAVRDLHHAPQITLAEGIPKTIEWMRKVYGF